jgi:hypothetical protein
MNKSDQIKRLKADSAATMKALQKEASERRFLVGSHNATRLKESLVEGGRVDLIDRTLLTPTMHKAHAERLGKRYETNWTKLRSKVLSSWTKTPVAFRPAKPTDSEVADKHYRFLTLVDSVTAVDAGAALQACKSLKEKLTTTASTTRGVSCLGVIEVEVVSLELMEKFSKATKTTASEQRKINVCKTLAESLNSTLYSSDESLFLIHFHGIITAKQESQFADFETQLKKESSWTRAPRQIMMRPLSKQYNGKLKSVTQNLKHLATYFTKGGNDWYAKKAYLRYKIGFESDDLDVTDEDTWVAKNWRRNALLQKEHSDEGIVDQLSLTSYEITQLAITIDGLMGLNRTRTGYLVSVR